MQPRFNKILSFQNIICNNFVSNGIALQLIGGASAVICAHQPFPYPAREEFVRFVAPSKHNFFLLDCPGTGKRSKVVYVFYSARVSCEEEKETHKQNHQKIPGQSSANVCLIVCVLFFSVFGKVRFPNPV